MGVTGSVARDLSVAGAGPDIQTERPGRLTALHRARLDGSAADPKHD